MSIGCRETVQKGNRGGRCGVSTTSLFMHIHVSVSLMKWAQKMSQKSLWMYLKVYCFDIQMFSWAQHLDRFVFFRCTHTALLNRFLWRPRPAEHSCNSKIWMLICENKKWYVVRNWISSPQVQRKLQRTWKWIRLKQVQSDVRCSILIQQMSFFWRWPYK